MHLDELTEELRRLVEAQPPVPPGRPAVARRVLRRRLGLATAAAGTALAVVLTAVVITRPGSTTRRVAAGPSTSSATARPAPIAAPPLLHRALTPTGWVRLADGVQDGKPWSFYAKVNGAQPAPFADSVDQAGRPLPGGLRGMLGQPGLASALIFDGFAGGGGPSGNPRDMSSLSFGMFAPPGVSLMLMGVTSTQASQVRVSLGDGTPAVTTPALADPALPGLWFFVTALPGPKVSNVEVLDARGRAVLLADPTMFGSGPTAGCPGQFDPRTRPRDPGLADTLPEAGTTTKAHVVAALAQNEPVLRASLGATRITVGPGWGLAYRQLSSGKTQIVDEEDYAYLAHFSSAAQCPTGAVFGFNDAGQRVPVIYVVDAAS